MNVFELWTETGHDPIPHSPYSVVWFSVTCRSNRCSAPHLGFFPLNRIITLQHKQV